MVSNKVSSDEKFSAIAATTAGLAVAISGYIKSGVELAPDSHIADYVYVAGMWITAVLCLMIWLGDHKENPAIPALTWFCMQLYIWIAYTAGWFHVVANWVDSLW